jgi:hypothetical protein
MPVGEAQARRQAETVEALVSDLAQATEPDATVTALRTALERGWADEVQSALKDFESRKKAEIQRVCHRHYSEFFDSVEELMKMRKDLRDLESSMSSLNEGVQGSGRATLAIAKALQQQQHAKSNIAVASSIVKRANDVVGLIMNAFVLIHDEKYYSALNTMDAIQSRLSSLGRIQFASQLRDWMPSLTDMINRATKEEMSQWLVDIRDASYKIGQAAMRRYSRVHASSVAVAAPQQNAAPSSAPATATFSVRFLLRLEEALGCSLGLQEDEILEFVPLFLRMDDTSSMEDDDSILDQMGSFLHPVHRALHIFDRLNLMEDFHSWYLDYRRPMAELRSMITRDLDLLNADGFLTYLPTLASGVSGFFIVEHALLQKVDHKAGILSQAQLDESWTNCVASLRALIEQHVSSLSRPGHFHQVKETLLAMTQLGRDLDLDTRSLMDMLRQLKEPYQKLLLVAFEGECRRILSGETYQPMEIQTEEDYEAYVMPLGLDAGNPAAAAAEADPDVDDLYVYRSSSRSSGSGLGGGGLVGGMRLPTTMEFSETVPALSFALLKVCGMMMTFVSYLEVTNAGALVFSTLERACATVRAVIGEQLASAESDGHIFRASQISVNCMYLSGMPTYLAMAMKDCLSGLNLGAAEIVAAGGHSGEGDSQDLALVASGKSFEELSGRAWDVIFEMVRSKADDLLQGMRFVQWEPSALRRSPHPYCEDLVGYLRMIFMQLSALPLSMREAAHFTCMKHVSDVMLSVALGSSVEGMNIIGMYNLRVDVRALMDFCGESGIAQLGECLAHLYQLLDVVLCFDEETILDPGRRSARYPRLDASDLLQLLDKFRNLSLALKIKNTVGDEVPGLDKSKVKQVASKLRSQLR